MKIVYLICLFSLMASAQSGNTELRFTQLTDDLYVYTTHKFFSGSQFPSNSMYLVTDEGVVLIDTPWDKTQFEPLLDSITRRHGKKVVLCLSTHFHDDRTAGLGFFAEKGIATYSSKHTHDLCRAHGQPLAQHYFQKDTVFTVGGRRIETFYPGEGHTRDNIVVWFPEDKILYGGCFVKSHENDDLGNIADANVEAWDDSLERLMERYHPAIVVPGHFAWSRGSKALRHTLRLLRG